MRIADYQLAVEAAADIWSLWEVCQAYTQARGFRRYYYAHLPPIGAPDEGELRFRTEGFDKDVVRTFFESGCYQAGRLLQHAKANLHPFYWDEVPSDKRTLSDPEFYTLRRRAEEIRGICIPVFGPNGRNGLASLEMPESKERLNSEELHELQWAAQLGHLRYCALWVPELGPQPRLSPREKEILIWVARGKSNPAIAEILGISVHTVDAHLRRIYLKLGVFDRITAAVRAIGVGLINTGQSAGLPLENEPLSPPKVTNAGQ
ncbi:LuxR C-terminal-related transcriptional regulator [Amaricoccus macauensis]|uniref:helix-turn-helix transcriptional regulator n=1 Tax=Amaricoccus macauensis TaxID=57001 RepID=UPI003C7A128A